MRHGAWWPAGGRAGRAVMLGVLLLVPSAACAPAGPAAPAAVPQSTAGGTGRPATGMGAAAPLEQLRVAYASTGLTQAYTWVAQDTGIFREEGLDVDLQYVPGSNVANQALLAG